MPFSWSGAVHWSSTATQTVSAAALSALLMTSAMTHFRDPGFYRQVVPDYLCRDDGAAAGEPRRARPLAVMTREEWIALSGLAVAGAAVGLLIPPTRRATATGAAALFVVFLAGHVDAIRRAYGPEGSPTQRKVHTARLPLQVPLILWAWSLRNAGRRGS
ncbi:MAG TPA: hypothetical protein VJ617_19055 [Arthrobacter sp.]|nr:hypothetical protein [Arthrobacter sp.]